MSLLRAIKAQLGLSTTSANNFTFDASADNGSMKLSRGNAGSTTQDVLTVDNAGKVSAPQGFLGFDVSLSASGGYIKFPSWCFSGLVIQFGNFAHGTTDGSTANVTFPLRFPSTVFNVNVTANAAAVTSAATAVSTTGFTAVFNHRVSGTAVGNSGYYVAFGN